MNDPNSREQIEKDLAELVRNGECSPKEAKEATEYFVSLAERLKSGELTETQANLEAVRFTGRTLKRREKN